MKSASEMVVLEQVLVADREERTSQRGEHRQLIVWPFDRGQGRAQGFDLLAIVKRLAADEQVLHSARVERIDVWARHVVAVAEKAAEENADVPGLQADEPVGMRTLGDFPSALRDQPVDVGADGVG